MSADDRLASPTLALLYIAQGHVKRARATVDAVLEHDPLHAVALAIRDRLAARPSVHVRVVTEPPSLEITWNVGSRQARLPSLHVIVALWSDDDCAASVRVTSWRCATQRGSQTYWGLAPTGAAAVCVGGLDDHGRFVPVAVADPVTW